MTTAGLEKVKTAKLNGSWDKKVMSMSSYEMPDELESALSGNEAARIFFESLSSSQRNLFIGWIASAKKAETRERRTNESLNLLSNKQKLGMK